MSSASLSPSFAAALRDGTWLDADRARAYVRIQFALAVLIGVAWLASSPGGVDPQGHLIGTDFVSFYTASRLALDGHPALAWDIPAHWAAQRALVGWPVDYTAFFYPPPYLLICWPLALVPYGWSLAIWLAATGSACWLVIRRLCPRLDPIAFLAFPAALITCAHGQNAFLTTAIFGAGLLARDRRQVLGGLILGLMAVKPQLVLALPFALLFARRWTTIAAAIVSALSVSAVSWLAFGTDAWGNFLADSHFARQALEHHLIGDEKMQSLFGAVRLLGGSIPFAYCLQAVGAAAAVSALYVLHRRAFRSAAEPAVVVCACLIASPFLLDYDLMLLAIPLAWLTDQGLRSGFRPFEKTVALCGYGAPLVCRTIAGTFGLPLGPAVVAAILLCVLRRALLTEAVSAPQPVIREGEGAARPGPRKVLPAP